MLINEAAQLATFLDIVAPASILDIGSATRVDREIAQPHIYAAYRGHKVYWSDLKPGPGLLYCDITDKDTLVNLPRCDMVTCCSMLEHVTDIDIAIENLVTLVEKWLIVDAPHNFPEHHCPIDNLWRPTPEELGAKVTAAGLRVVEATLSTPETFWGVENASVSMVLAYRDVEVPDADPLA